MKITANSIEELIENTTNRALLIQLLELVNECCDDTPTFIDTPSINLIGWYLKEYKNSTYYQADLWPAIAIAPQRNHVALYIYITTNNAWFLEQYHDNFKKSEIGKSCLRIKKIDETNVELITEIINDAVAYIES